MSQLIFGKILVFKMDFESIPLTEKDGKILKEIELSSPNSNTLSGNFSLIELSEGAELL